MGSIEIKEQARPPRSPFKRTNDRRQSKSPFRQAILPNSQYYKQLSPIKHAQITPITITQSSKRQSNVRKIPNSPINSKAKTVVKTPREVEWCNNRQKCEEIIKRVRNFNDFLLEIRQRLKDNTVLQKQNSTSKCSVSINVKLQNQRIELQKYRKLVERELSKTHSIQKINIQSSAGGENVLTIHYDNSNSTLLKGQTKPELVSKAMLQSQNMEPPKSTAPLKDRSKEFREIKTKFMLLKRDCRQLRQKLSSESRLYDEALSEDRLLELKQRNEHIELIIEKLQQANQQSRCLQSRVRSLI